MQGISQNGYSSAEILDVLRAKRGTRQFDFRFDLLDSSHNLIRSLTNIYSGEINYDALADIKRTAKFQASDLADNVNYLSNRIKPWVRVAMPKKTGTYESKMKDIPNNFARWKFDETSGTAIANSNPTYPNLTWAVNGAVSLGQAPLVGSGYSIGFDGNTGKTLNSSTIPAYFNTLSKTTFSMWARIDDWSNARSLVSSYNGSTLQFEISARNASYFDSSRLRVISVGFGVGPTLFSYFETSSLSSKITLGVPFNITFTWASGLGAQIFINGDNLTATENLSGSSSGFLNFGNFMKIGNGTGLPWNGRIDDWAAWDQKLDAQAVTDLYQSGAGVGGFGTLNYAEWPQGVFILSSPQRSINSSASVTRNIDAYDLLQILTDDKVPSRYYINSNYLYTDAITEIINGTVGIPVGTSDIVASTARTTSQLEWEPGTSKITIINDLLSALNYRSLWFDGNGRLQARPYVTPAARVSEFDYSADANSVIVADATQTLDYYSVPNQWVAVVSDADKPPLMSRITNNDASSPTSTVSRGRTIVDFRTEEQAATQSILDAKVLRYASEQLSIFDTVEFTTGIMPFHADSDCYNINYPGFGVSGKYVETSWSFPLTPGGAMKHSARKSVAISGVLG